MTRMLYVVLLIEMVVEIPVMNFCLCGHFRQSERLWSAVLPRELRHIFVKVVSDFLLRRPHWSLGGPGGRDRGTLCGRREAGGGRRGLCSACWVEGPEPDPGSPQCRAPPQSWWPGSWGICCFYVSPEFLSEDPRVYWRRRRGWRWPRISWFHQSEDSLGWRAEFSWSLALIVPTRFVNHRKHFV